MREREINWVFIMHKVM
jgi:hypothetical protein